MLLRHSRAGQQQCSKPAMSIDNFLFDLLNFIPIEWQWSQKIEKRYEIYWREMLCKGSFSKLLTHRLPHGERPHLFAVLENNKFLPEFFHLLSSMKREVEKKTRKVSFNFVEFSYVVKSTWRFMWNVKKGEMKWSRQKLVTCDKIKYPSYRRQSVVKFTLNCSSQFTLFRDRDILSKMLEYWIRRECLTKRSTISVEKQFALLNIEFVGVSRYISQEIEFSILIHILRSLILI